MKNETLSVVIMAGGLGKRMNSDLPKVLHKVGEIPMLVRVINQVKKLTDKEYFAFPLDDQNFVFLEIRKISFL